MDMLLLAAACVASVWGIIFLRLAGLLGLVVAMLIAGTVFGHPFFHVSALTLDRALLVFALVLWAIQYRLGLLVAKPWSSADAILAIFISILTLNVFLHNWRVEGMEPVSRFAFYYAMPMLTYWLARQCSATLRGIQGIYVTMAVFGLYVAGTAVMERLGWTWAIFPRGAFPFCVGYC